MQNERQETGNAAPQHSHPRMPDAPPAPAGLLGTSMYHQSFSYKLENPPAEPFVFANLVPFIPEAY